MGRTLVWGDGHGCRSTPPAHSRCACDPEGDSTPGVPRRTSLSDVVELFWVVENGGMLNAADHQPLSRRLFYCDHYAIPLPPAHKFPMAKNALPRELLEADGFYRFDLA